MIEFGINNEENNEAPFLISIEEGGVNCVKFIVALPYKGEVGSKIDDTGINELNKLLVNASPLYPNSSKKYEIIFEHYILYQTRNESYCSWDNYEIRNGKYFIIFSKSRMLDFLSQITDCGKLEDGTAYPGEWKHFGIYCQNHVIDIISCHEPTILRHFRELWSGLDILRCIRRE